MSPLWYTLVSFVIVFLVSMPISLVTGSLDYSQLDPKLIRHPADIVLWWLPEEKRSRWRFDVGENYVRIINDFFSPITIRFPSESYSNVFALLLWTNSCAGPIAVYRSVVYWENRLTPRKGYGRVRERSPPL